MHWHRLPEGVLLSLTLAAENIEVSMHQILGQISVMPCWRHSFGSFSGE